MFIDLKPLQADVDCEAKGRRQRNLKEDISNSGTLVAAVNPIFVQPSPSSPDKNFTNKKSENRPKTLG